MEYVISALWFALELVGFYFLWGAFLPRTKSKIRFLLCYITAWVFNVGFAFLEFDSGMERIVFFSVYAVLCCVNYKASVLQKLLVVLVSYIFGAIVDTIVLYGCSALMQISLGELVWRKLQYTSVVTIGKLFTILLGWMIFRTRRIQKVERIHTKWLLLTVLFPVLTTILLSYVFSGYYDHADLSLGAVIIAIVAAVANVGIVYLIHAMEKSAAASKQNALLHMQMEIQLDGILALERNYRAQRKATHEFRAQLQTLYDLLLQGDCDSAKTYVRQVQDMQPTRVMAVNSHHPVLDAVLNHKYQTAQEHDIQVDVKVNDLSNLTIESNYLVVLMSNLLDNAIEACMKLEKERCICCSVVQKDSVLISVRNTSLPVEIIEDSIPTTKLYKKDHGYGVPHIQNIVDMLEGEYAFAYEDGWFEFVIEIPNSKR